MIPDQADRNSLITEVVVGRARGVTNFLINNWGIENRLHDDLYSAANLALLEARDKYNGSGNFCMYAMVYVRARVIDEIRKQLGKNDGKNYRGHSDQAKSIKRAGELFEWDHPSAIDERYSRYVDRDFLLSLANKPRTREIILLILAGYTEDEIAEKYGISASRISQIIHKLNPLSSRDSSYSPWV